jgi:regulatory protein
VTLYRRSEVDRRTSRREKTATADGSGDESSGDLSKGQPDETVIRATAVRLLARREHSTEELRRKLELKGYPAASVAVIVEQLCGKRLVSDTRYVTSFVHHHANRGHGPIRIRAELRQQGVADTDIDSELDSGQYDWEALARETHARKFGRQSSDKSGRERTSGIRSNGFRSRGMAERAKQARFLQYRGFNADQIRAALKSAAGSELPDAEMDPGI